MRKRASPQASPREPARLSVGCRVLRCRRDGVGRREEPPRYESGFRAQGSNQRFDRLLRHAVARALTTAPSLAGVGPAAPKILTPQRWRRKRRPGRCRANGPRAPIVMTAAQEGDGRRGAWSRNVTRERTFLGQARRKSPWRRCLADCVCALVTTSELCATSTAQTGTVRGRRDACTATDAGAPCRPRECRCAVASSSSCNARASASRTCADGLRSRPCSRRM